MRIDEFSAPSNIDGSLSSTEMTRFMSFGFDIAPSAPVVTEPIIIQEIDFTSNQYTQLSYESASDIENDLENTTYINLSIEILSDIEDIEVN